MRMMNTRNQKKLRRDYLQKVNKQITFTQFTYDNLQRIGWKPSDDKSKELLENRLNLLKELKMYVEYVDFNQFHHLHILHNWPSLKEYGVINLERNMQKLREKDQFLTREVYLHNLTT